jgi:hypothetical protein
VVEGLAPNLELYSMTYPISGAVCGSRTYPISGAVRGSRTYPISGAVRGSRTYPISGAVCDIIGDHIWSCLQ